MPYWRRVFAHNGDKSCIYECPICKTLTFVPEECTECPENKCRECGHIMEGTKGEDERQ